MAGFQYNTVNGVIVPDTSTTKADVQQEFLTAFGSDLALDDTTPQGRLIDMETNSRDEYVRTMAEFANMVNPNVSVGVFLQAICGLHGIEPNVASYSLASNCVITGQTGLTIPANSRVKKSSTGDIFQTVFAVTIGPGTTASVDVRSQEKGPIQAAIGEIDTIVDGLLGWTSITNPTAAVVGVAASTDDDLRVERSAQLAKFSKGTPDAIKSNLAVVFGVRYSQLRENDSDTQKFIDGVMMDSRTTWVCVQGGSDGDVAAALLAAKQSGSPWTTGAGNGTPVSVSLVNPSSGQTYIVQFTRGVAVPVQIRVTVSQGRSSLDPNAAVPSAIMDYANGTMPGEIGFVLGASVSPFELSGAVSSENPGMVIRKVEVGIIGSPDQYDVVEIPMALWQFATISPSAISVVVV